MPGALSRVRVRQNVAVQVTRPRRLRFLAAVVMAAAASLGLAACDPGHPFVDLQVKVFSTGDGTASVEVAAIAPDDRPFDEQAFAEAMVAALAIGEPTGPATEPLGPYGTAPTFRLEGVDRNTLTVAVPTVLRVAEAAGFSTDATTFLSLCTSLRSGRASGTDVTIVHLDTCAIWDSADALSRGVDDAVARLEFEPRQTPARSSSVYVAVVLLVGIASAIVALRTRQRRRAALAIGVCIVSMVVSVGVAAIAFVWAIRLNDPWPDTGQVFDRNLARSSLVLAIVTVVGGVVLPGLLLLGRWLSRRRWPA
jgi:hypothetical protein